MPDIGRGPQPSQHVLEFGGLEAQVQRRGDRAEPEAGEICERNLRVVSKMQRDPVAGLHADPREARREPCRLRRQPRVRPAVAILDEGQPLRRHDEIVEQVPRIGLPGCSIVKRIRGARPARKEFAA